MQIGKRIIEVRKDLGMTQEELAQKAKITVRTVQRIETGGNVPRDFTLKSIALALNISIDELKGNQEQKDNYWLVILNLSSFCFLLLPLLNIIVPAQILKRHRNELDINLARKIISRQIYWSILTHGMLLIIMLYNFFQYAQLHNQYAVSYIFPVVVLFALNVFIILSTHFRLVKGKALRLSGI